MIKKESLNHGSQVKVTFSLLADGRSIAVAGDFNHWDPVATPLKKRGKKVSASVTLDAGDHCRFRYVDGDGNWFDDEEADAFADNGLGGTNGVILLRPARLPQRRTT